MNNGYGQGPQSPFYQPPRPVDDHAKNAQVFGIVAVIGLFVFQVLSIVFGAMAMSQAKQSRKALGYECSEAHTGRICGTVGLIIGIISCVAIVLYVIAMCIGAFLLLISVTKYGI
ncbi:MAG: hypothetical protein IJY50_02935 [Clostridia bacterium]|nr:hypothetical protein [Clostridia bacterium]